MVNLWLTFYLIPLWRLLLKRYQSFILGVGSLRYSILIQCGYVDGDVRLQRHVASILTLRQGREMRNRAGGFDNVMSIACESVSIRQVLDVPPYLKLS